MDFEVVQGDISKVDVDALVTGATTSLKPDLGGPRALKYAAGAAEIQAECDEKSPLGLGGAVETDAYDLDAEYVIHAAIREPDGDVTEPVIRDATAHTLSTADTLGCESIALLVLGKTPCSVDSPSFERRGTCMLEVILEYEPTSLTSVIVVSNRDRRDDRRSNPIWGVADEVRKNYDETGGFTNPYWRNKEWEDTHWKDDVLQFGLPVVINSECNENSETEVLLSGDVIQIDQDVTVQVGDTVEYKDSGQSYRIEEELPRPDAGYTAYRVSSA